MRAECRGVSGKFVGCEVVKFEGDEFEGTDAIGCGGGEDDCVVVGSGGTGRIGPCCKEIEREESGCENI